jgi:nucleoside-diphosphate-sugar epimerase/acyl carrier protein/SAM-dependent methyltransferase
MAIETAISLVPDFGAAGLIPQIRKVVNQTPMCVDHQKIFYIDLERQGVSNYSWSWKIVSIGKQDKSTATYVTGTIAFSSADDSGYQLEFGRFERLVEYRRCLEVLESDDADDVVQGRSIYKVFSDVVDYGKQFFGLRKLVGKNNQSAGIVSRTHSGETWLDPFLGDCFSQVAGIWVNCMTDRKANDMYIATGFEQWTRSAKLIKDKSYTRPELWHVFAQHNTSTSENGYISDIFIFDSATGELAEIILGIQYTRVSKLSMSKILSRLTSPGELKTKNVQAVAASQVDPDQPQIQTLHPMPPQPIQPLENSNSGSTELPVQDNLTGRLKEVLAEISGLEVSEIQTDSELADLGIDSLLGMEMSHEIESVFDCTLPSDDLMQVTNFQGLLQCLRSALGIVDQDENDLSSKNVGLDESQSDTPVSTKATSLASSTAGSAVLNARDDIADDLSLPSWAVLKAFGESKLLTDQFITDYQCSGYMNTINPRQSQLCVALTVEAFEHLGCSLRSARAGQRLQRLSHIPEHGRLVEYLYKMLEETRLVDIDGSQVLRTAVAVPSKSSEDILQGLERDFPNHTFANQLSFWTGSKLADVLTGKTDGLKLIFATEKGRELVSGLYGDSHLNKLSYKQMSDFLSRLVSILAKQNFEGPLKILEMGAGTGGTTKWLVPLLAGLEVPCEYTFTDLSPSFVAGARKRFKDYPFMKFRVHDIEKVPADDLLHSQHVVIASNAIHATRNLATSTKNIHKMLRPDGFLMMLEMTETLHWVDIIFGVLEGWWLFDDGRKHAIAHQSRWDREFQSAGYGHVDWTDGNAPEVNIQRIFIALASGPRLDRLPIAPPSTQSDPKNYEARRGVVDEFVMKYVSGFHVPTSSKIVSSAVTCVLITGASGSVGAHLVAHLAKLSSVDKIVCLNRYSNVNPHERQLQALKSRGISLDDSSISKLKVFDADTAKPLLGLPQEEYEGLLNSVTHIVHCAWPMSGKLPVKGFKLQFEVMRNLIELASGVSSRSPHDFKVTFQFVSSIATVGYYPLWSGKPQVPEERVTIESVLPNGYGDAKFICERMLDETLLKHPDKFRTMSVRLGQVAGSSHVGYWNHMEHFAFMLKSSQTLKALPDFDGLLSWTPVDLVAASLGDLILSDVKPYPFYHIDNPVRQPWKEMIPVLASELGVPKERIIPFSEWVRCVRNFPGAVEWDNPAAKLVDFFDNDFVRMSCGGVLLETTNAQEHSPTMRGVGRVDELVTRKYIQAWKDSGFLHS